MSIDVLIITALYEELEALFAATMENGLQWLADRDLDGFRYHVYETPTSDDGTLRIAAAWAGAMGEPAAATRSSSLIQFLRPRSLAMCGICAGRRGDVFLGDVIVANRVFSYDHGKLVAITDPKGRRQEEFFHDIETYNLEKVWAMDATYFSSQTKWCHSILADRPISIGSQKDWFLDSLLKYEKGDGLSPDNHPDRNVACPTWKDTIKALITEKLIRLSGGTAHLTKKGAEQACNVSFVRGSDAISDPPFRVHVGPIGTGKTVRKDPEIFHRIKRLERAVLGLEMEAAAIGFVAEQANIPCLIAKSVSDYGDLYKDDSFRIFASKASALFLLSFLREHPPISLLSQKNKLLPSHTTQELAKEVSAILLPELIKASESINTSSH